MIDHDILVALVSASATATLAAAGYFIKRKLERTSEVDKFLDRSERLMRIAKNAAPESILPAITAPDTPAGSLPAGVAFANEAISEYHMSQAQITRSAGERMREARKDMLEALSACERALRNGERAALRESQAAFEHYADLQSRLVAAQFDGGTIYPTVVYMELHSLYGDRAKQLKNLLERRR